ncbi:MAG: hypothetical protein WCD24_02595, partial [Serratia inhibens]|uniref:hypothetical protein n=1 Tax=Serratia inhibens TaxID=2338073 RepID=UPI003C7B2E3D
MIDALDADRLWSIAIFVCLAGLATWAWLRWPPLSSLARVLAVAPVLFIVWFLAVSGARGLLLQGDIGSADVTGTSDVSVVWLVFDQLPTAMLIDEQGNIVSERFPGFSRLADQSTWYSRTTTVASSTALAVPAALTGKVPEPDALPVASHAAENLFTFFAGTHRVHAWENLTQLCPDSVCRPDETMPMTPSLVHDTTVVAG